MDAAAVRPEANLLQERGHMGKKRGKKKKQSENFWVLFGCGATCVYLAVMLGLFPVFYPGHLFGISSVKRMFFLIASGVFLCLMSAPVVARGLAYAKERTKVKLDVCDIFAAASLLSVALSLAVSLNPKESFAGTTSGKVGALVMGLCILAYFVIKYWARYYDWIIKTAMAASAFIYLCGIFLTCKVDILGMQDGIQEVQKAVFISPLGNVDYNVAYVGLMLSGAMAMFLLGREVIHKYAFMAYLFIGFLDVFCVRTESALVMMAAVFAVLLYFALEREEWLSRYFLIAGLFFGANCTIYLMKLLFKDHMYDFSGTHLLLLRTDVIVMELLLVAALLWLSVKRKAPKKETLTRIRKAYGILLLAGLAAIVVLFVVMNAAFRENPPQNILGSLVVVDDTATRRGYAWLRSVELFQKLPLKNQLFGCGLSNFYDFIYPTYGEDMLNRFAAVFYEPHNDFLQALVCTGIFGAVSFFGLIAATIVRAVRKRKDQELQLMVILALTSFLVQGLVNTYTIFIVPLLFIVMGMAYMPSKTDG